MLKIKDNLFNKKQIRSIQERYFANKNCDGLYIEYINDSFDIVYGATIEDIIDLEKVEE
jgi:hypothetical protein|nr:MAG TPA: hypothetical protein [Caudoviricetes sp.]